MGGGRSWHDRRTGSSQPDSLGWLGAGGSARFVGLARSRVELARSGRVSPRAPSWLDFPRAAADRAGDRAGSVTLGEPARDRASSIPRASPENRARSTGLGQLNSPATVKHLVVGCVVVPSPLSLVVVVHLERARVTSLVPGGTVERSA